MSAGLIQSLESRRMLSSTIPPLPNFTNIINETVYEYANVPQQGRIAYLPDVKVSQLSQLHGSIGWGDGGTSDAHFEFDKAGGIDVLGTHDYTRTGIFSIGSTLSETAPVIPGKPTPQYEMLLGTIATTARVTPAPVEITETAGKPFTATLAKFNQFTLDVTFSATINWGDGTTSAGTLSGGDLSQGNWQVQGDHTFKKPGYYVVHTSVYTHVVGSKFVGSPVVYTTLIDVIPRAV